jgi:hypothetical protein
LYDVGDEAMNMLGVWYDFTEKGYWSLLARFGTLSNTDIVFKSYDSAGIYLGAEMKRDYENNSEGYVSNPDDDLFQVNPQNLYVYCDKNNFLREADSFSRDGDIVFYGEGNEVAHVSLVQASCGGVSVIDAGTSNKVDLLSFDEVAKKYGNVIGFCRIINN